MRNSVTLVTLAVFIIAALSAQAARLLFKDPEGTVRTYKGVYNVRGAMDMPGMGSIPLNITMAFTVREKVNEVRADGTANVTDELCDGTLAMKINDEEKKVPFPGYIMTYDRTNLGKISNVKMSGEGVEQLKQMQGMGMGMNENIMSQFGQGFPFPDRELAMGDTWKASVAMEAMPGMKMNVNALMKLVGTKVVDNKSYLQIATDLTMNMPKFEVKGTEGAASGMAMSMTMKGKATTLFDEQAGALFAANFEGTMAMTMTMPNPESDEDISATTTMTITGNLKQVKAGADAAFTTPATN